ncbi:MAG: recombinase RecT [Thermoanaerobacteraceae bacterium]|nr:recombinase RecT [Thermoanaerobacteraceae bacterium]
MGKNNQNLKNKLAERANGLSGSVTNTVKGLLSQESYKKRFEEVLGKRAPGFISSLINLVNGNTNLQECIPQTVIASAAVAATLDLPIDPNLGFAYIVPYKVKGVAKAQFQMGYKGFIQLAMRTGQYKTINAAEVYEGEIKSHNRITGEIEFDFDNKQSDKIIGYVAYFKLLNGFEKYLYMTVEEIEAHAKRYSKSYNSSSSPWKTDFHSMALKTVIKRLLSKYGILSIEMQTAVKVDQAVINQVDDNGNFDYDYVDTEAREIPDEEAGDTQAKTAVEEQMPDWLKHEEVPGNTNDQ